MEEPSSEQFNDEWDSTDFIGINDDDWTQEGIMKSLEGFVDKDDNLEMLSNNILEFIDVAKNHPNECVIASDKQFKVLGIIKGNDATSIKVPKEHIKSVEGSHFGLTGHSHPSSKIPLPDLSDLEYGCITLNSKYNLIYAPNFGVTIIKQSKPKSKPKSENISTAHDNAYTKRGNYVVRTADKIKEEYKEYIKINHVSYIQQKHDFDTIENKAEYIKLEVQCGFYNEELKKYGIEIIYIKP